MRSRVDTDRDETESLEVTQARLEGKQQAMDELTTSMDDIENTEVADAINSTLNAMSLYHTFDEMGEVVGALTSLDMELNTENSGYGFDDIDEVQTIQDKAERVRNSTRGTKYSGLGDAIYNTVSRETPKLLQELAMDGENLTF